MSMNELYYLAEILGKERPEVRRMLQNAALNPQNVYIIQKHMMLLLKKRGFDLADLPQFSLNLPEGIDLGGIFAGNVLFGNMIAGKLSVPVESFAEHTLVCGHSGSGKSFLIRLIVPQLIKKGISVVIFDSENEYKVLLKLLKPEDVYIIDPQNDRDNFLEPPPGCPPGEWLAKLKNLFREVFYLRDGSINLLDVLLHNLYTNMGIFSGGRHYPVLADINGLLDRTQFRPGTRFYGYHESLSNRFKSLQDSLGETLACRKGYALFKEGEERVRLVIYRTGSLSDDTKNFYINLKMMKEATYREKLAAQGLKTVFVIEEAHKLYNEKISKRYDLGESMLFSSSRTFRKRGIGCIYSDQVPSELPNALSGNVNNHFIFRLVNGKCIWRMSQAINLRPQQSECLPVMPKRQCIFQSGNYPDPVLVEVPELSFEYVGEEEVETHMKPVLSKLGYAPAAERPAVEASAGMTGTEAGKRQPKPGKVWTDILKLLAENSPMSLADICPNLSGVNLWQARKILADMEKQEMIEICPISFGTRGNPKSFVVLKPKGAEFIGTDYERARLAGKGSTEHVIIQHLIAKAMRNAGKTASVEYQANGKAVDVAEIRDDRSIAYEIELAPGHPHVAENVKKDFEAGFDAIVVITRNQAGQDEARAQVYKSVEWEKLSKVEFRLLKECL
jgi:hypothetical protein